MDRLVSLKRHNCGDFPVLAHRQTGIICIPHGHLLKLVSLAALHSNIRLEWSETNQVCVCICLPLKTGGVIKEQALLL